MHNEVLTDMDYLVAVHHLCRCRVKRTWDMMTLSSGDFSIRDGLTGRFRAQGSHRGHGRGAGRTRVVIAIALLVVATGCNSWGKTFGPSASSRASATWDASEDWVDLVADRRSSQSGCTTTWFDWDRNQMHYDARAVRDCDDDSGSTQDRNYKWAGEIVTVRGMQRLAICTSGLEPPNTRPGSNCEKHPESDNIESFSKFSDTTCIGWRLRSSTGVLTSNSGGVASDCSR